jgi:hypothetical protein
MVASFSAVFVLSLAACGGDDGDDDSSALPPQDELTVPDVSIPDVSIPSVSIPDVSIPVSIPDVSIPGLSIPDFSIPDFSIPEGLEVTDEMIDMMVASFEQSGMNVDRECVADAIEGVDLSVLTDQAQTMSPEFIQQFIACLMP